MTSSFTAVGAQMSGISIEECNPYYHVKQGSNKRWTHLGRNIKDYSNTRYEYMKKQDEKQEYAIIPPCLRMEKTEVSIKRYKDEDGEEQPSPHHDHYMSLYMDGMNRYPTYVSWKNTKEIYMKSERNMRDNISREQMLLSPSTFVNTEPCSMFMDIENYKSDLRMDYVARYGFVREGLRNLIDRHGEDVAAYGKESDPEKKRVMADALMFTRIAISELKLYMVDMSQEFQKKLRSLPGYVDESNKENVCDLTQSRFVQYPLRVDESHEEAISEYESRFCVQHVPYYSGLLFNPIGITANIHVKAESQYTSTPQYERIAASLVSDEHGFLYQMFKFSHCAELNKIAREQRLATNVKTSLDLDVAFGEGIRYPKCTSINISNERLLWLFSDYFPHVMKRHNRHCRVKQKVPTPRLEWDDETVYKDVGMTGVFINNVMLYKLAVECRLGLTDPLPIQVIRKRKYRYIDGYYERNKGNDKVCLIHLNDSESYMNIVNCTTVQSLYEDIATRNNPREIYEVQNYMNNGLFAWFRAHRFRLADVHGYMPTINAWSLSRIPSTRSAFNEKYMMCVVSVMRESNRVPLRHVSRYIDRSMRKRNGVPKKRDVCTSLMLVYSGFIANDGYDTYVREVDKEEKKNGNEVYVKRYLRCYAEEGSYFNSSRIVPESMFSPKVSLGKNLLRTVHTAKSLKYRPRTGSGLCWDRKFHYPLQRVVVYSDAYQQWLAQKRKEASRLMNQRRLHHHQASRKRGDPITRKSSTLSQQGNVKRPKRERKHWHR